MQGAYLCESTHLTLSVPTFFVFFTTLGKLVVIQLLLAINNTNCLSNERYCLWLFIVKSFLKLLLKKWKNLSLEIPFFCMGCEKAHIPGNQRVKGLLVTIFLCLRGLIWMQNINWISSAKLWKFTTSNTLLCNLPGHNYFFMPFLSWCIKWNSTHNSHLLPYFIFFGGHQVEWMPTD